jgi:hypothetical protein
MEFKVNEIYFSEPENEKDGVVWGRGFIVTKVTKCYVFFSTLHIWLNTKTKKYRIERHPGFYSEKDGVMYIAEHYRRKKGGKDLEAVKYNCIQYQGYTL